MKKLLALLLALLLLLLCSCAVQEEAVIDEPTDEPLRNEVEIFESEDGKFGAKIRYSEVLEPIYDSIEIYEHFFLVKEGETLKTFEFTGKQIGYDYSGFVSNEYRSELISYIGIVSEGTMKIISEDENGEPFFEEVPDERHYLINSEGIPYFSVPLENYEPMTEADEPEKLFIYGTAKGNRYEGWSQINGSEKLIRMEETKPETYIDEFGYEHTGYYYNWYGGYMKHGLNINGEVFIEPVYWGITVPFEDRIVLWYSAFMQGINCGYCRIIDLDKNVISDEYNRIDFFSFKDKSYVGVAYSAGEDSEEPIFDKNGGPMPEGLWFIDKDGNRISENLFEVVPAMNYSLEEDKIVIEGYKDGKEIKTEIPYDGYILK